MRAKVAGLTEPILILGGNDFFHNICRPEYTQNIFSLTKMSYFSLSLCMRKPTICLCENKGADQLRSNCEADQRLYFRYTDSAIPLLLKSIISSFKASSVTVQAGLCLTLSETEIVGFLTHRLSFYKLLIFRISWVEWNVHLVRLWHLVQDSHRD